MSTATPMYAYGRPTLADIVAANVRAEAARRRVSQSELARRMGENRQWISARWTGRTPWTLNDVERAAHALRVPPARLLECAARDSNPEPSDSRPAATVSSLDVARRSRSVDKGA